VETPTFAKASVETPTFAKASVETPTFAKASVETPTFAKASVENQGPHLRGIFLYLNVKIKNEVCNQSEGS
jgi:hypothetical protein